MAIGSKFIGYTPQLSIVIIFTGGLSNSRDRDLLTGNGLYVQYVVRPEYLLEVDFDASMSLLAKHKEADIHALYTNIIHSPISII